MCSKCYAPNLLIMLSQAGCETGLAPHLPRNSLPAPAKKYYYSMYFQTMITPIVFYILEKVNSCQFESLVLFITVLHKLFSSRFIVRLKIFLLSMSRCRIFVCLKGVTILCLFKHYRLLIYLLWTYDISPWGIKTQNNSVVFAFRCRRFFWPRGVPIPNVRQ